MTYKTKAIVLKSKSWPRNARLFILYTKKFGKVKGVAAGVEKIKSKVAGHLQPFCVTEVMMAKGRHIDRLAQARLEYGYSGITGDIALYARGAYVLEVLDSLTKEGISDEKIWNNLVEVLAELNNHGQWAGDSGNGESLRFDLLTRIFSLQMLDHMGYRPQLYKCVCCRRAVQAEGLHFSIFQGGVICAGCRSQSHESFQVEAELVKLFREIIARPLTEAARIVMSSATMAQAVNIIDQLVAVQTQQHISASQFINSVENYSFVV